MEEISWALNLAPVPADRSGQPSSACKIVLGGLASHAEPDGSSAFPSVATLVRSTGWPNGRCARAWTGTPREFESRILRHGDLQQHTGQALP